MRVIEPYQLRQVKKPKVKRHFWVWMAFLLGSLMIATSALGIWAYRLPLPLISADVVTIKSSGKPVSLPWPTYGQSTIGAVGYGVLASTKDQKAAPMASVAKVMTALAVLRAKPLSGKEQGPTLNLTAADVAIYDKYVAQDGSVVAVQAGEQLSERQALEALLLPSANNIADSLVIWAFGSSAKYTDYANRLAKELGLDSTLIDDASGFSPKTVSTANDLVKLGQVAIQNPVIADIVAKPNSTIPVEGEIKNVNSLLGQAGIVGIKTGNTSQAGGCYLFAAKHKYGDQSITVIGAIMGASTLGQAMRDSLPLLNESFKDFTSRKLISKGDKLGYYDLPWGGQVAAVAKADLSVLGWKASKLSAQIFLNDISVNTDSGAAVGAAQNGNQYVKLVSGSNIVSPDWRWRLFRWL